VIEKTSGTLIVKLNRVYPMFFRSLCPMFFRSPFTNPRLCKIGSLGRNLEFFRIHVPLRIVTVLFGCACHMMLKKIRMVIGVKTSPSTYIINFVPIIVCVIFVLGKMYYFCDCSLDVQTCVY